MTTLISWGTIAAGLRAPYPHPELDDTTVPVAYTGHTGAVHFHAGCSPLLPGRKVNPHPTTRNVRLADLPTEIRPARRHTCADDFHLWLSPRDQDQLRLLAEASRALDPLAQALDSATRHGRELIPYDNTPFTSGALTALIADTKAHLIAYPVRAEMHALRERLEQAQSTWEDLLARREAIEATDPLAHILTWAHNEQLPDLRGTPKQVRWAQRIRYDAAQAGTVDHVILQTETSANVWIGLEMREEVTTTAWYALKQREDERHAWQQQRPLSSCYCNCHR